VSVKSVNEAEQDEVLTEKVRGIFGELRKVEAEFTYRTIPVRIRIDSTDYETDQ